MKPTSKKNSAWLATVFLIVAVAPAWAFGPQVERSLELNGISDMFGHKSALFILTQPDIWATPRSFVLPEGGSEFGVKLLAVDMKSGRAQIEKDGLKQSLRLRTAVDILPSTVPTAASDMAKNSASGPDGLSRSVDPNNPFDDRLAGNPGYGSLPAKNNGNPTSRKNPAPDSTSAPDSIPGANNANDIDPAIALADQSKTEWYQESANIEQQRIETAQAVLTGEMTPWPRTPLTPPGTSSRLVENEAFFSDHIPGYRQPPSF